MFLVRVVDGEWRAKRAPHMAKRRGSDRGDSLEHVAAYHKELQLCLREHESKFDNAALLVAGGAFTISAAFISDLPTPLNAGIWLAISWFSWGLCLSFGVGGHLVGAHATKCVLDLLDSQVYDFHILMAGKAAKLIKPLNVATFMLLIAGFLAFGRFTFENLAFGDQSEEEQQSRKEEGRQEEDGARAIGAFAPVAEPTLAAAQTNVPQVRADHGRPEDAATTTAAPPVQPPRTPKSDPVPHTRERPTVHTVPNPPPGWRPPPKK
jgi:hypothetical protein